MFFWMLRRITGVCASSNVAYNLAWKKLSAKLKGRKPPLFSLMVISPVCPFQAYCSKGVCARGGFVHGLVASAGSGMDRQRCRFLAGSVEPPQTALCPFQALRSEHVMPNAGEGCKKGWS